MSQPTAAAAVATATTAAPAAGSAGGEVPTADPGVTATDASKVGA